MDDGFQYFFGGGAAHPAEALRYALYSSTSGSEGVSTPGALQVVPLDPMGAGVQVLPGGGLIVSRYQVNDEQSYQRTLTRAVSVEVAATGSSPSGGRSDLVVLRVEDPYRDTSPWPAPLEDERADASYVHVRVIPGVPAGTTRLQDVPGYQNDTAITLARIDIPPSTGLITAEHIVDLRELAQPKMLEVVRARPLTGNEGETLTSTRTGGAHGGGEWFPNDGALQYFDIPSWATSMIVEAKWGGVTAGAGNSYGRCWVEYGPHVATSDRQYLAAQAYRFNTPNTSDAKNVEMYCWDTRTVPVAVRGTRQPFVLKARLDGTSAPGARPKIDALSGVMLRVLFIQDRAAYLSSS